CCASVVRVAPSFAQAEIHFVGLAFQIVINAVIPPTEVVALGRAVRGSRHPLVALFCLPLAKKALQPDGEPNAFSRQLELFWSFYKFERRQGKMFEIEAVSASQRNIFKWRSFAR